MIRHAVISTASSSRRSLLKAAEFATRQRTTCPRNFLTPHIIAVPRECFSTTSTGGGDATTTKSLEQSLREVLQRRSEKENSSERLPATTRVSRDLLTFLPCALSLNMPNAVMPDEHSNDDASTQHPMATMNSMAEFRANVGETAGQQSLTTEQLNSHQAVKPQASNSESFKAGFRAALVPRPKKVKATSPKRSSITAKKKRKTWGDHIAASGVRVTHTPWIVIDDISPNSSLEAMIEAVHKTLDEEMERGIVDLNAPFVPKSEAPMLKVTKEEVAARPVDKPYPYVIEARLILSPFARPKGWYVQLAHRSMAQVLLSRSRRGNKLHILSKPVTVKEYKQDKGEPAFPMTLPVISDATVRVENCHSNMAKMSFLNFFSRFDLSMDQESVVPWCGVTPDGKEPSSSTFLVHFADPSWARAAIRERQGASLSGTPVRLVQYPRQLLQSTDSQ